jgi:DNA-binding winged helix-turn-helix (wHTH) protein/Tfp pilus assembly protein PilF
MTRECFTFGDATLDVAERRATRLGRELALSPKAFDLLAHLVRRAGALVTKQELLDAVWPNAFVEEGIVSVHVSALRKALGDDPAAARYIQTVAKSGYRFIAAVRADRAVTATSPGSPDVCELVGRARAHLLSARRTEVPDAIRAFTAAIALDPTYAPAHAGLALAHSAEAEWRLTAPASAFAQARASALRALAMDDASADALTALGAVMFMGEWDWIGAERSLQRALEVAPTHTQARVLYGRLLETQGKLTEGLAMKLRALETDPFSPSVHLAIALSYWNQRRFEDATRWANKTLELDAGHGLAREFLAGAYWAMGDFDRHMAEGLTHAAAHGVPASALDELGRTYAAGGRAAVVRLTLQQAAQHSGGFPDIQCALLHAELGDLDSALPHLEKAIDARDPCLVDLAVSPQWDAFRGDARFERCLLGMRLAPRISP